MVVVKRDSDLFEVVAALGATGGLTRRLDGRQEQGDQNGDDGNHDEQLNQREATPSLRAHRTVLSCARSVSSDRFRDEERMETYRIDSRPSR
jgi:hypothetical protein